jgi:hypothetical protein
MYWSPKWTTHHRLYEDHHETALGFLTHFAAGQHLRLALSHILTHNTVLPPHCLDLRDMVLPQKGVTQVSLGVDQTPSLPPKAGLNLNLGSYQSDEWGSQVGSWAFLGSFVWPNPTSLVHWERGSLPSHQLSSCGAWQGQPSWGCWACDEEVKILLLNPGHEPLGMLQEVSDRDEAPKLFRSKFIKQARIH